MTLSELIGQGYYEENDLNCAEAILHGSNLVYGLGLDTAALKLAAGFGGGMHIEAACGALTGSIMVIGRIFTSHREHDSPQVQKLCRELLVGFQTEMGSTDCKYLKDRYHSEQLKCRRMVDKAAQILDLLVAREGKTATCRPDTNVDSVAAGIHDPERGSGHHGLKETNG